MILVFNHLRFDSLQLLCHRFIVVIVESVAFPGHIQPHGDVQPIFERAIQRLLSRLTGVFRAPRPEGIAAVFRQLFRAAKFQARALDEKWLSVHEKFPMPVHVPHFHFRRPSGLLHLRRDTTKGQGGNGCDGQQPFHRDHSFLSHKF